MAITPLPAAPSRAVPSTFSTLADAFLGALSTFVTEANALETNVNAKEVIVTAQASAAATAMASANFKGLWSALSGALAVPASVSHLGRYWMLITASSNITADVPGTSAKWQEIGNVTIQDFQAAVNPKAMSQGVAMTYAASGSTGIQVANNANINFGTGNFTLCWKGSLPDWTPSAAGLCFTKIQHATLRWYLQLNTNGKWALVIQDGVGDIVNKELSIAPNLVDGTTATLSFVVTRETAAIAGSFALYVNGYLHESIAIPAGTPPTATNTGILNIMGRGDLGVRYESTTHFAATYNRALTAAEVLDLYRNGIAAKHRKAAQTALTSGTLVAGQEYTIDTFVAGDDFANVGGTNVTGNVFAATGTTPTTWTNSSSLRATGGTLILEPEGIQPVQWLDAGANRLHAMQPAAGSRLTCTKRDFTIKWTNTWAASHEVQYIGGLNQAILPPNCYIDSIIGVITGGTIEDIIIGDGSDTDRWVTITTGLAAGTVAFTIANAISDGTNYKMTVDPDANFTGSIAWTINGKIL